MGKILNVFSELFYIIKEILWPDLVLAVCFIAMIFVATHSNHKQQNKESVCEVPTSIVSYSTKG